MRALGVLAACLICLAAAPLLGAPAERPDVAPFTGLTLASATSGTSSVPSSLTLSGLTLSGSTLVLSDLTLSDSTLVLSGSTVVLSHLTAAGGSAPVLFSFVVFSSASATGPVLHGHGFSDFPEIMDGAAWSLKSADLHALWIVSRDWHAGDATDAQVIQVLRDMVRTGELTDTWLHSKILDIEWFVRDIEHDLWCHTDDPGYGACD